MALKQIMKRYNKALAVTGDKQTAVDQVYRNMQFVNSDTQSPQMIAKDPIPFVAKPVTGTTVMNTVKDAVKVLQSDPVMLPKTRELKRAEEILTDQNPANSILNFTRNPYLIGVMFIVVVFLIIAITRK